jgi:G3E family GTPase
MISAMDRLVSSGNVDILIGEPVGSCTDLSATVLQPLKKIHGKQFHLAPFSVLVDGNQVRVLNRLRTAAAQDGASRFPDNVLYIYQKQLEEADLIVLNKIDLLSQTELQELKQSLEHQFPGTPILDMSAQDGAGVDAWLDWVLRDAPAGRKVVEVDYDTYAAGEAALGWMNASVKLSAQADTDWSAFAGRLLESIRTELKSQSAEIAHLKLYLTADGGHLVGNVTSNDGQASVRGSMDASIRSAALLINARVHVQPDRLRTVVETSLTATAGDRLAVEIVQIRSLFPGRPQPTHRFSGVV